MNQAGMFGPSIAFNEHRIAPAASALGRRDGAADEYTRNRRAAKKERQRKRDATRGKACAAPPRRRRWHYRATQRALRRAFKEGASHVRIEALLKQLRGFMPAGAL